MRDWKMRVNVVDLFEDESLSFEEVRDAIVKRLDALVLQDVEPEEHVRYEDVVDTLRYSDDEEEFDGNWDDLYDWADSNGLWIETFIPEERTQT